MIMNMIVAQRSSSQAVTTVASVARSTTYIDPLDSDHPDDAVVVTTRRAICRVALVAAEAASRFQREAVHHDPMTWMLAPRELFHGATALEACLELDACIRGVLIHGLSLGMDADPDAIDALGADDEDAPVIETRGRTAEILPFMRQPEPGLRLFTATVVAHAFGETVHAFHASLAADEAQVAGRLFCRIGAASAEARIMEGFDASDPLVAALVAPAMCDTLELVAADPASQLAAGLDVNIEQRFHG